ncbi:hypothetical protein [Nonomuraea sp. NPDC003804]|uniref:hypothetical protein n=1 Tax=Nonomuraea sp. NPDC003804 TaxID=3154547 RepID=UPI0033B9B980
MDLPEWEAVYEPGNVSDYLIGYLNDEAPAKAAAEAWLRTQKEGIGRLEWGYLATSGEYDEWWDLAEIDDEDGAITDTGIIVRRRTAQQAGESG